MIDTTLRATQKANQPGSNNQVLLNKLDITSSVEMDQVELELLDLLYEDVISDVSTDQVITAADLSAWHHRWLGNVYEWAGRQRSVNMGKGDVEFAAASQISRLLDELDRKYLSVYTPCEGYSEEQLVQAIATIHVEFILVHPFREGNGRLARLLANIMALQAGWPELDFSLLDNKKSQYFSAIQAGWDCNYEPLGKLIRQVLRDSESGFPE
ncbi:Fic/DOC family protein [Porticoccus sp. GXU_MW_L64]